MNRSKIFLLSISLLLISSCNEENIIIPTEFVPSSEFFPLSVGNYWKYEESFSSADTNYTNNYTSTITGVEEIGGYSWFKIESVKNNVTYKRYLMMQNDSVYELQYAWQNPVRSLEYILPSAKQQSFWALLGGDAMIKKTVTKFDTVLNTKVGSFKDCLQFESLISTWTRKEILVFGVGIVESQFIGNDLGWGKPFKRIAKIVDVKIK